MNRVIISAPFGNWLTFPGCTSTLGTFTFKYRGGLLWRLWRCLLTLRYDFKRRGWTNKLGLPNPGVDSLPYCGYGTADKICSVHGFDKMDWHCVMNRVTKPLRQFAAVEMNLSCPNVGIDHHMEDVRGPIESHLFCDKTPIIAKLPPVAWTPMAVELHRFGIRHFHCCNTIPTKVGGLSGKTLKPLSLLAVEWIKQRWGEEVTVIGGGGITSAEDALDYRKAGADRVSIASMLLNPLNWRRVKDVVEAMR